MATITLQLGNYSNFVASHLWNLHDSVLSEDVSEQDDVEDYTTLNLYKCTERKGDESRVPRTVLLDLRENIIGLSCTDAESSTTGVSQSIWGGALKTVERPNHSHVKPDWNSASQSSSRWSSET
jgi:Misato Segment II tubulin-like domain